MKVVKQSEGEIRQPDPGWKRVSLAGSSNVSVEYFEKPPRHTSPLHRHPSEQVCIVISGHLRVDNGGNETAELGAGDSVRFAPNELHRIENTGDTLAAGVDIFVPGRSFDFWTRSRT